MFMRKAKRFNTVLATTTSQVQWLPSDLANLVVWLDANDISTLWQDTGATSPVTTDAQLVARWNDKSGNGNNVTNGSAADQPTYKVSIQNSKPALLFDGTNFLDTAGTFANYPLTWLAVIKNTGTSGTTRGIISTYLSGGVGGSRYYMNGTDTITGYIADSLTSVTKQNTAVTIASGTSLIAGMSTDSSNINTWVNGTKTNNPHTLGSVSNIMRVGGYNAGSLATMFVGYLCEFVAYNSLLSDGNVATLTSYLNTKWSIY